MTTSRPSRKFLIKEDELTEEGLLEKLVSRRSVHPRRLVHPGPDQNDLRQIVEAAVTAVDHCGLRPWRFISIRGDSLNKLGDVFVEIKLSRNKDISAEEVSRERNRAVAVPVILAIVERVTPAHAVVPVKEQHASVGAAIQNIVLSAHLLGYGAKMVSGKKVSHPRLAEVLHLSSNEKVFGFVCMGTGVEGTRHQPRPDVDDVLSVWNPNTCPGREQHSGLRDAEQAWL